jgi:nitrogen-specific signal transduction histidine kinase/CheY-like chemotaxis protein
VQDISQQQKMEERLQRAEKMEALGLLAGGVAHDLNNVIGISTGYSEMLLDDMEPDSPLRSHVECIMQATDRAAAIVQDMLTMARRGVTVNKVINLNIVVKELLAEPELSAMLAPHPNVEMKTILAPELLNIEGSPVHMAKTILNLIANAAEATRNHGVICLSTKNVHLDRPVKGYDSFMEGDYAVISVSDTGDGIPAENLPHIFEPFYTKKVMGRSGTGLGLAVVWGTVKDHRGYIDVASKPGQGTVFSLYFPVIREELTAGHEAADRSAYIGKGEMILIVDDIPEQRALASRLLGKLNYMAYCVGSGEEAVEFMKKSKADLVVLDMIMDPGIDGFETYQRILEVHPGQKAIIVSGFAETNRVTEAQKLGAGAYVKKPYIMETLGMAVRQELDRLP